MGYGLFGNVTKLILRYFYYYYSSSVMTGSSWIVLMKDKISEKKGKKSDPESNSLRSF